VLIRREERIAAEEFGHIELVAVAINPHHFLAGGQGALCQDSRGNPWTGDSVFSSGDLVEDLTHNFFLETGARADWLPARARRRASGRLRARRRAADGRRPVQALPGLGTCAR